ncbi:MAG: M48 family metallopeptidase [Granulosicoccus sp.]
MSIAGYWFEPDTSTRFEASLEVTGASYRLIANNIAREGTLTELVISDRLGDTPRRLQWPDGAVFETRANDVIDKLLAASGHKASRPVWLHRIESHWGWVATALVVTVLVSYIGIRYGLPAASESIARKLPASVNETVSDQALATMDRLIFDESETSALKKADVQQQFDDLLAALPESDVNFKLHFRNMNGIANAMALPGGDVVVTDAFIELVEHPEELDSVLLHEIGHVLEHHGMTQVIRASAISVIVSMAFGDLSAIGEIAVGVPVFVMQNSYSQTAESEADAFAFEWMQNTGKDPKHFASIILRLTDEELNEDEDEDRSSYFSSHPDSRERAKKALEASRAMNL